MELPYACMGGQRHWVLDMLHTAFHSPHKRRVHPMVRYLGSGGMAALPLLPAHTACGPLPLPTLVGREHLTRQTCLCSHC